MKTSNMVKQSKSPISFTCNIAQAVIKGLKRFFSALFYYFSSSFFEVMFSDRSPGKTGY